MDYRKINDYQIYVYDSKGIDCDLIAIIEISDNNYGGKSYDARPINDENKFMRFDKISNAKNYIKELSC